MVAIALWALGIYWAFNPVWEQSINSLATRMNTAIASVLSIVPALSLAVVSSWFCDWLLGQNWTGSVAFLFCVAAGVYHLGRSQQLKEKP